MRLLAISAALALAGCGGVESGGAENQAASADEAPAPAPQAAVANASGSGAAEPAAVALTAEGFGPLRIGMSRAEVVKALGEDSNPNAVGGPEPEACDQFRPARAPEGMLVMIEKGRLTSIALVHGSKITTDRGLGLGATAASVRKAYGPALSAEPHKYESAPAEYLTMWAKNGPRGDEFVEDPAARGIRYVIDGKGLVEAIHAGGPSLQYVEGCA